MDIIKVLIEFVVYFLVVYLFYYVFIIRKCKKDKKLVPVEVNLILSMYDIDIKKIDVLQMVNLVSLVTTFVISLIITLIGVFFENRIILLIFGTLISVIIAFILYRLIGKHYEKISKKTS